MVITRWFLWCSHWGASEILRGMMNFHLCVTSRWKRQVKETILWKNWWWAELWKGCVRTSQVSHTFWLATAGLRLEFPVVSATPPPEKHLGLCFGVGQSQVSVKRHCDWLGEWKAVGFWSCVFLQSGWLWWRRWWWWWKVEGRSLKGHALEQLGWDLHTVPPTGRKNTSFCANLKAFSECSRVVVVKLLTVSARKKHPVKYGKGCGKHAEGSRLEPNFVCSLSQL